MKFLRFILTFSLVLNLVTQASTPCDMKACKVSKKVTTCCKKETVQTIECCCAKMKCKTVIKYNDVQALSSHKTLSTQHNYLVLQDFFIIINKANPLFFLI